MGSGVGTISDSGVRVESACGVVSGDGVGVISSGIEAVSRLGVAVGVTPPSRFRSRSLAPRSILGF